MEVSKNLSFCYDIGNNADHYLIFAMLFMQLRGLVQSDVVMPNTALPKQFYADAFMVTPQNLTLKFSLLGLQKWQGDGNNFSDR